MAPTLFAIHLLLSPVAVGAEARAALGGDLDALSVAQELESAYGWKMSAEPKAVLAGGWRGSIEVQPEWPVGPHRAQLDFIEAALIDFDRFFTALSSSASRPVGFRWRNVRLSTFQSSASQAVSAYARDGTIAYNLVGDRLRTATHARETLFHELFHLNDRSWSTTELQGLFDEIVDKCGDRNNRSCLQAYAPSETLVDGETYYAFHPEEGVEEYAAEVALRYYREQRQVLVEGRAVRRPFKCESPENAMAWNLVADAFFGGLDSVGPCHEPPRQRQARLD